MRRFVPHLLRQSLRRMRHARQIRRGTFFDNSDPLFARLDEWAQPGTTVVDVGAAVGTFSVRLGLLVGATGRVVAIEPMPDQFEILVSNAATVRHRNITCLQLAAGERSGICHMSVPLSRGVPNWYMSHVDGQGMGTPVIQASLDDLPLPRPVSLLKIDAEGHDFAVLRGAKRLLKEDRPVIFIENDGPEICEWLSNLGYSVPPLKHVDSPNAVFRPTVEQHDSLD